MSAGICFGGEELEHADAFEEEWRTLGEDVDLVFDVGEELAPDVSWDGPAAG